MNGESRPVALVTGSATGVGRACVLQFAGRGYDVVVNYSRSEAEAIETAADAKKIGAEVLLSQCDVSDDNSVQQMISDVEAKFGRLDVVVNNAATTSFIDHSDLDAMTEDLWDRILAVNLKGAFCKPCCYTFAEKWRWRSHCEYQFRCGDHGQWIICRVLRKQGGPQYDDQITGSCTGA